MRKWVDQQTFDELLLANAEEAEREIMQLNESIASCIDDLRKYVPNAGFYYWVYHDEKTHQNHYVSVSLGFEKNEILFLIQIQSYPKTFYTLWCDLTKFKYTDRYSKQKAFENLSQPNRIGVFTKKKIGEWVNYITQGYRNLEKINAENESKITAFRKRLMALPDVQWDDSSRGTITRGGLKYNFCIWETYYTQEVSLDYTISSLDDFLAISNNKYVQ